MITINTETAACINEAALRYCVPATLIVSVLRVEDGRRGLASFNKNGTYDYGAMQINAVWLKTLSHYGYTVEDIQWNVCKNIEAGTWILSQNIAEGESLWRGLGNYHSHELNKNTAYQKKVRRIYESMNSYLNNEKE